MLFADAHRAYVAHISHERGLSPHTSVIYTERIASYSTFVRARGVLEGDLEAVFTVSLVKEYLYHLSGDTKLRPRTIRNRICPFRSFGTWCVEEGIYASSPAEEIKTPKLGAAQRSAVSEDELQGLMDAVELQASARRVALDRAMLYTLVMAGVR